MPLLFPLPVLNAYCFQGYACPPAADCNPPDRHVQAVAKLEEALWIAQEELAEEQSQLCPVHSIRLNNRPYEYVCSDGKQLPRQPFS